MLTELVSKKIGRKRVSRQIDSKLVFELTLPLRFRRKVVLHVNSRLAILDELHSKIFDLGSTYRF